LLLAEPARAALIVFRCYDGASSAAVGWGTGQPSYRFSGCDLDRTQNGRCHFRVSLGATGRRLPRVVVVTLRTGRRKWVRYADTMALLKCRPGPEPSPPVVCQPEPPPDAVPYTCQDAVLANPAADPACDVDRACDDSCTFGFRCPTACGSLAPCWEDPRYHIEVPVGRRRVLPACDRVEVRPALVLACQPPSAGFVCPPTTTTTLPVGRCITDEDCAKFLPACHHCEVGNCEGFPTFYPNRGIGNIGCPLPQ